MNNDDLNFLIKSFESLGISLDDNQVNSFYKYYQMLVEKNKVMNLTAITEIDDVITKHFIDSISLVKVFSELSQYEKEDNNDSIEPIRILDLGTGAGFPGLPVKISCPELSVTLMDSLEKRLKFLDEVITALDLKDCDTVHSRAEDAGRNKKFREKYDIVTARAVAKLSVLAEYCLPLVKVGGVFLAMKAHSEEEEAEGAKAIALLGGTIEKTDTFKLPGTDMERTIIVVRKIRPTPARFPRKAGTPSKTPIA